MAVFTDRAAWVAATANFGSVVITTEDFDDEEISPTPTESVNLIGSNIDVNVAAGVADDLGDLAIIESSATDKELKIRVDPDDANDPQVVTFTLPGSAVAVAIDYDGVNRITSFTRAFVRINGSVFDLNPSDLSLQGFMGWVSSCGVDITAFEIIPDPDSTSGQEDMRLREIEYGVLSNLFV